MTPSHDSRRRDETAPDIDAIETAAAAWLVERDEGFAPGRAEAFAAWRAADPRHAAAFAEAEQAFAMIGSGMPALRAPLAASVAAEWHGQSAAGRPRRAAPAWIAAGIAAALAFAAGVWWRSGAVVTVATPQTIAATAEPQQVALEDGSVVNLNTASSVRVQLSPHERRIALDAGEAHFAVAHDESRPFIVTAAGVSVRAVGTAFSVRVGESGVEVLVTEGRVEVTRTARPLDAPILGAAERLVVPLAASVVAPLPERVSADALRDAIRWHRAVMTFADVPLRDVIVQFNRRNAVQLAVPDAALAARRIGGTFAVDQAEAFVRLLVQDGEIVAEPRGAGEIVLRRAP